MPNAMSECLNDHALETVAARARSLLERQPRVRIAVDGCCAAGKTTAAAELAALLGANVFHMDDFFLPPERRTPERLAEPGGNVDYERFERRVLLPLFSGEAVAVERYDCGLDRLLPPVVYTPRPVSIVEGAYSLHPRLAPRYDVKVFLRIDPALQTERIRARNGENALKRFLSLWIPLENAYFNAFSIEQSCDYVFTAARGE